MFSIELIEHVMYNGCVWSKTATSFTLKTGGAIQQNQGGESYEKTFFSNGFGVVIQPR